MELGVIPSVFSADLDGDGDNDLAVANWLQSRPYCINVAEYQSRRYCISVAE